MKHKTKNRLYLSSSELTSEFMINYIKEWEKKIAPAKKEHKENEKQNKSLVFSKLDQAKVIKKYSAVTSDQEIKDRCIKGLSILKQEKPENDAALQNSILPDLQTPRSITPLQLVTQTPAPSPNASPSLNGMQVCLKSPKNMKCKVICRSAKIILPKNVDTLMSASQPI